MKAELREAHRSNRQLKAFLTLVVLSALAVANLGARKPEKIHRAERFELVDDRGEVRGVMGTWGDSPYLRLDDPDGGGVILLTQGGNVSMSMFTDSPRHPRVHVMASDEGSAITLLDRNGEARAVVEVDPTGDVSEIVRPERASRTALAPWRPATPTGTGLEDLWDTTPR
ncbi:MAG: hypothetical protein H6737_18830 [Alphaproteobacteria bacterium]|nr:hypothetical protein [Alphaproteobacteria bacterium]